LNIEGLDLSSTIKAKKSTKGNQEVRKRRGKAGGTICQRGKLNPYRAALSSRLGPGGAKLRGRELRSH